MRYLIALALARAEYFGPTLHARLLSFVIMITIIIINNNYGHTNRQQRSWWLLLRLTLLRAKTSA